MMYHIPVLAVDAGGTSCRSAACNLEGRILAFESGGPCNYQNVGTQVATSNLTSVLTRLAEQIRRNTGVHPHARLSIGEAVFGIAGLDTERDRSVIEEMVRTVLAMANLEVQSIGLYNDGMITLLGIVGDRPGVLVTSGTGSVVCGQGRDGRLIRVRGWGHRVGDPGSGHAMGQAAIEHVFSAFDGFEGPSLLSRAVLEHLRLDSVDDLLAWLYSENYSIERVAELAVTVFDCAREGDYTAKRIVNEAGRRLALACHTVIQRLGLDEDDLRIGIAGGVLQNDTLVLDAMVETLHTWYRHFEIIRAHREPIYSALVHGLRRLKHAGPEVEARCAEDLSQWIQFKTCVHQGL